MEDRKLEAAESLALIGRMIENTRSRMVRNSGRPLLAWGYATVLTTLAVGGVAAIILAPFTLIAGNMWQPLLFIAGFVVMMIVPGHILNYKSNHPAR